MTNNPTSEEIGHLLKFIGFDWLTGLNLLGVSFVLTFAVGYLLRRIERVDNKYMWWLIVPVPFIYACLATTQQSDWRDWMLKIVYGIVSSTIAVLLVVLAHDKLFSFIATKFPLLSFLVSDSAIAAKQDANPQTNNEKQT